MDAVQAPGQVLGRKPEADPQAAVDPEVIAGNDKGTRGRVLRILNKKDRVVVQGVNLRWKHMRKSQKHPQGARLRRETSINVSNVMLFDEAAGKRTRVLIGEAGGKRVRLSAVSGNAINAGAIAVSVKADPKAKKSKKKEGEG